MQLNTESVEYKEIFMDLYNFNLLQLWLFKQLPYTYKDLMALYLEVGRYNDLAGWYLQYDGLSLKKPEIPLGIIGQ